MKLQYRIRDRGFEVRAWYIPNSGGDAIIRIYRGRKLHRQFLFPAYKVWNIPAHFRDIVDGEVEKNMSGYGIAAWNGIGPVPQVDPSMGQAQD